MALVDHHDVFIGSTDDGHTFVVLNRAIPAARRILAEAGFTAHEHHGRTVYLHPPGTAPDARERAGVAMYELLAHTMDFADLSWTVSGPDSTSQVESDVVFRFTDATVSATASTAGSRAILPQHGFAPTAQGQTYRLPDGLSERERVGTVVRADSHLHAAGITVRVHLGIPTPHAIPAPPRRAQASVPGGPATQPTRRRAP